MNRFLAAAGRVGVIFCVVTSVAVVIFIGTLAFNGFLTGERLDAAVRGIRGEPPPAAPAAAAVAPVAGPTPGDLRELETLVTMAEARERDLRQQADRVRAEKRTAEKTATEKPAAGTVSGGAASGSGIAASVTPAPSDRFKTNLDVLRNHVPKTAATLMADWETPEIVTYLRAMKPYEAADILSALLAMGQKGETDYAKKAKDVQEALGKQ
jgi:hypothetical protein